MIMKFILKKENHLIFAIYSFKKCFKIIFDAIEDIQFKHMKAYNRIKWLAFGRVNWSDNLLSLIK